MVEALFATPTPEPAAPLHAQEVTRLRARVEGGGRGGTALVRGPRGVGKGALAADLAAAVRTLPGAVVFDGATPPAGGRSFHPFAELVRQAVSWAEQAHQADALVDPLLVDLGPALDADAADAAPVPSLDQKFRFFEAVRRLLAGVAERAPMLAIVHDLERADGDTLELAGYLAEHLFADPVRPDGAGRPGLLLLLVRDDRSTPPRARDFVADVEERASAEMVRLSGLDLHGLRLYLQHSRLLEKVLAASDGMPHEIDELFEALPSNVEQLFERRLAAMSAVERVVLRALSLSSRPASARTLATVSGFPIKDVAVALAAHKTARILERRISSGEQQFSFARRGNLEVTARTGDAEELARLHAGWAHALADPGSDADPALLAHHQLRSDEPVRGVPLAIAAAETHAVAGAFDAAAALLEEALMPAGGELRLAILGRLSELASLRAKPREAIRWVELWKAELPPAERGRALLREAELLNALGDHDRALEVVEGARAALPAGPAQGSALERSALEAARAEALYQRSRFDEARETGLAGLAVLDACSEGGAIPARIALLNLLGKIASRREIPGEAKARFHEALALARCAGLAREEARGLVNIGFVEMRAGDLGAAEVSLRAGIAVAREAHDLSHRAYGEMNLGVIAHMRGELGRALDHYWAARSLFQPLGNRTQLARVLMNLANLCCQVGDVARARAHVDEALRLTTHGAETVLGLVRVVEALVLAKEGRHEAAVALLGEVVEQLRAHGVERAVETLLELAEVHLGAGELEAAQAALDEAGRSMGQVRSARATLRAQVLRARVMGARDPVEGVAALEEAREAAQGRSGDGAWLADAELALGQAYLALGDEGTARAHLVAARAVHQRVAAELPEGLRGVFAATGARAEVAAALAGIDPPVEAPAVIEAERGARSPLVRTPEWDRAYGAIVGASPKLLRVFHILDRIAASDSTVLVVGESGTGKELVAEAIHKGSPRARGPFVKLNCAALVESLLMSELFGHERGAFTGAHQRKVGRFEMAAGGTIFLDEIGDISPQTQVSLLRVLQAREFERVGGGRPIRLEARVVCATNRNLPAMVREGTFREDLYYRLKGLSVELPSLRERPEDVEPLAARFLERYGRESGSPGRALSPEAAAMLARYAWPGNVRELENVVRSVALFADSARIEPRHFAEYRSLFDDGGSFPAPPAPGPHAQGTPRLALVTPPHGPPPSGPPSGALVSSMPAAPRPEDEGPPRPAVPPPDGAVIAPIFSDGVTLADLKKKIQEEAIAQALVLTRGNITKAAELLGMKRPRLSQIINGTEALKALCPGGAR